MAIATDVQAINERVASEAAFVDRLLSEVSKVIVGQQVMVDRLLIGLLCGGHVLLEGVPGLAKTLTISTLARTMSSSFSRIQFTPDLLPADLIGTMVYNQGSGDFFVQKGPIFAQLVLADEVNRAPAKVQSAMLEAMQERQVTIGTETFPMADPFLVLATQNPIEQEGTYPLPEAQIDRFMLKVRVGYPTRDEERTIVDRMGTGPEPEPSQVIRPEDVVRARSVVESVYVDEKVKDYIVDVIQATRYPSRAGLSELDQLIEFGCSPRGSIALLKGSKAHAFLRRRGYVTPEDVKAVGMDVLRHRVVLTYEAEAEELTPEDVVQKVLDHVEVP